ncbi:MAG: glycosyltransferase family 2 protein, partial [Solirubrobacteraceae bacterium]
PRVSIVVPLGDDPDRALACLQGIAAQPPELDYDVVVVADPASAVGPVLALLDGDVEVVDGDAGLSFAAAVALGAQRAGGQIVVLIRGAAVPNRDWLAPLVAALDDPGTALAVSTSGGDARSTPVLGALSAALRAADLRSVDLIRADDEHLIGALALALAQRGRGVCEVSESSIAPFQTAAPAAGHEPGRSAELTIVIPTLDVTSERIRRCVSAIRSATDVPHELVVVDNGSPPQGFTAPVNAGLRAVGTPYAVVMNDDVEPLPGWWAPLREALDHGAAIAFPLTVGGVARHDFAAWCFALSGAGIAELAHAPGEFFDPSMVVWYQDTDLHKRLCEAGRPPVLVETSQIRHGLSQTVGSDEPRLRAWIDAQVQRDRQQFLRKHPGAVLRPLKLAA